MDIANSGALNGLAGFRPLKIGLAGAIALLAAASIYLSLLIFERQASLNKVSRYNITWSAGQGVNEFLRLRQHVSDVATGNGGSKQDVQLRLDIVANRLGLFASGEFLPFIDESPPRQATVKALSDFVTRTQAVIENIENPETAKAVVATMIPLEADLIGLAAEANNYDSELASADRKELLELHWTFSALSWGLVLCTLGLILLLGWQNRLLMHTQQNLHILNDSLVEIGKNLTDANQAVTAANAELVVQNNLFDAALRNMSQGLCLFDADQRLIVSNRKMANMFGIAPDRLNPGTTLEEIKEFVIEAETCSRPNADAIHAQQQMLIVQKKRGALVQQLDDGRIISILHQPTADDGWVATYEDITERHQAEAQVAHMARHDALTDLPNRILLRDRMSEALVECQRRQTFAAILCLDLDNFKNVNDTLGHSVGDLLLRDVASRISGLVRHTDTVARLGGDEFVVLQVDVARVEDVDRFAQRIVDVIGEPYQLDGHQVVIGVSVGICIATGHEGDPEGLLKNADLALYRAKGDGRGMYRFFEPEMDARLQRRRTIELDLRAADFDKEFELVFQPIVNLRTKKVTTLEALLRWPGCRHGPVETEEIVNIAEDTGLIVSLGEWVLEQACKEAASLPGELNFAVNLSPMQFKRGNVVDMVKRVLATTGFPAGRLELEITESLLLEDSLRSSLALQELRMLGTKVSLDDFGTGYSSLSYLRKFTVDKIKIDRRFVEEISKNRDHMAIVHAIVSLSHALGMATTAEGVETEEQLDIIRATGCDEAQGYYFSPPKSAAALKDYLAPRGKKSAAG